MKVCDKHLDRVAVDTLHIAKDDTYVDLCQECKTQVYSLLHEKEAPKKQKNSAKAD